MNTKDLDKLRSQLILHEGVRLKPYLDTKGKLTLGVGRNITDRPITMGTVMQMLDEDVNEVLKDLSTFGWFDHLGPIRQRVMMDMRFNLGPSRFRGFKNMLAAMDKGEYAKAAAEMLESDWAKDVKSRAMRLVLMMSSGEDYL